MSLMQQKELNALLKKATKAGKDWQELIQECCIQAIGHSVAHGNVMPAVSVANDVLAAMPEGARKQAIINYLEAFGFLKYYPKTKDKPATFKHYDKVKQAAKPLECEKAWTEQYEEMLRFVKWYAFSKEKTLQSSHTVMGDVTAFIASMTRRYKAKDGQELPKDSELIELIISTVNDYKEHRAELANEALSNQQALEAMQKAA